MAIKPQELKIEINGIVDLIEQALDKQIKKSRVTTGVFMMYDNFKGLEFQDVREAVGAELRKRYKAAGWEVSHVDLSHHSDQRDGNSVSVKYNFKEHNLPLGH